MYYYKNEKNEIYAYEEEVSQEFIIDYSLTEINKVEVDILIEQNSKNYFNGLDYNEKRKITYPSITDQLDMLWHMMDNEIIPGKDSPWYNTILSVKEEYPKPE